MKFNYRQEVLTLPGAVLSALPEASAEAIRVLLWLSSDPTLADKPRQPAHLAGNDLHIMLLQHLKTEQAWN